MLAKAVFTNLDDETITFNNFPFGDGSDPTWQLPCHKFVTDSPVRHQKRTRPYGHGIFKSPTMLGEGTIHMEGDVLYESGGDTISAIKLLKRTLFGDPTVEPITDRTQGTLNVWLELDAADPTILTEYTTPDGCSVDDYSFELSNGNPSVVPYLITFLCYKPYLVNVDDEEDFFIL